MFAIWELVDFSMSRSNSCFLTCIQISQKAGQMVWYSHLFQNFPYFVTIHTVKGFGVVNKAEVDVFLELSCFFYDSVEWWGLKTALNMFKEFGSKQIYTSFKKLYRKWGQKLERNVKPGNVFFLELSCFFYDPVDIGNLISGSSAFYKSILYI